MLKDIITTIELTLNNIECIARPSSLNDVRVNVLSLRINHMIDSGVDLCDVLDMLDREDTWVA